VSARSSGSRGAKSGSSQAHGGAGCRAAAARPGPAPLSANPCTDPPQPRRCSMSSADGSGVVPEIAGRARVDEDKPGNSGTELNGDRGQQRPGPLCDEDHGIGAVAHGVADGREGMPSAGSNRGTNQRRDDRPPSTPLEFACNRMPRARPEHGAVKKHEDGDPLHSTGESRPGAKSRARLRPVLEGPPRRDPRRVPGGCRDRR
jgi:hypothetical protein